GKLPLNLKEMPIDMLCLSSHKHHGPKGVGLFYKREKSQPIQIPPLIIGGQQENGMRGGTHNMASIVGMAKALELSVKEEPLHKKTEKLRDYFEEALLEKIPHIVINGKNAKRIFNTTNITFKYARASQIIIESPQIAMSTGSACVTGSRDPSHVLRAMRVEEEDCFCSLRFSLSKWTTRQEVEEAIRILEKSLHKVRSESPLWSLFRDGII
ncbi:MAG TPA: aminotransferase class V-fold PLP-dependent enzyme, partial [Sphingobacterium sp.]|nr:aminotransferase class V-fold PLP-dependent enzyme [Sphingobacterium sp.]